MQIQLETIELDHQSSFRIMMNPRLNHLFFWHFHPEFELVFIEGANGTRHVGNHISKYEESDLVLIGGNIPHLNFDYGIQEEYEHIVLHLQPDFIHKVFDEVPELMALKGLFQRSQYGIAFGQNIKNEIGERLKNIDTLNSFEQFIEVVKIFELLSKTEEYQLLHEAPYVNHSSKRERERLKMIYAYVDENFRNKIEINQIADMCSLTNSAFCRYFKKATGNTFINFLNQYRVSEAKRLLLTGKNVSEACYECGFESLSYFNRTFRKVTGVNPSTFKGNHL